MPLHVAFHPSGAGSLSHALSIATRNQRVVCLHDNLCLGRLASLEARAAWMYQIVDDEDFAQRAAWLEEAWRELLDPQTELIVWFGHRSAADLLGLFEVLARRGDRGVKVIDVCAVPLIMANGSVVEVERLGEVSPRQLSAMVNADRATDVPAAILHDAKTLWPRLKEEDASLRLFGPDGRIASMQISHFDAAMIAEASTVWIAHQQICGRLMDTRTDARDAGYPFLIERLFALTQEGALQFRDVRNDVDYPVWEVRKP